MRWSLPWSCAILLGAVLTLGSTPGACAEDWPGWRKDGSGVSKESALPVQWGPDDNLRWKSALPGAGLSSPIVWQDRVFVTAVAPGTIRHLATPIYATLLGLLALVALGWYADGTPSDPLGQQIRAEGRQRPLVGLVRKSVLLVLFLSVAYGVLLGCEEFRDTYPEAARRILDKPWEFNGHSSRPIPLVRFWKSRQPGDNDRLEVNPQIPPDCYLAGFLASFAMLGLNGLLRSRGQLAAHTSPRPVAYEELVPWVQALLVTGLAGSFFVAVGTYTLAGPPHGETTTWYQTANICLLGLIALIGSTDRASAWRLVGVGLALGTVVSLLLPDFLTPTKTDWHEDFWATHFAVYAAVTIVMSCGFCLDSVRARRRSEFLPGSAGQRPQASWALLLAGIVFFVAGNYFLPAAAWLRQLVCLERTSGAILWVTTCAAAPSIVERWPSAPETLATPTPVTDGQHVYARFGGVGVFCVDLTGRVVWTSADPVPPAHWVASSPVLWQELLIVTYDVEKRALTRALDKRTGKVRWEADRTALIQPKNYFLFDAYSTPLVVSRGRSAQLVHHSSFYLCAYDLETGKELWHRPTPCGQIVASPVAWHELLFVPGGISNKLLLALKLEEQAGQHQPREVWEETRQVPEIASPVVYADCLYTATPAGMATCRQATKNVLLWKERLHARCEASLTAGDGKIYFCDVDGLTTVVAAGPEFRVLARNALDESVQASCAIASGNLFIRGSKHLFCIGAKADSTRAVP